MVERGQDSGRAPQMYSMSCLHESAIRAEEWIGVSIPAWVEEPIGPPIFEISENFSNTISAVKVSGRNEGRTDSFCSVLWNRGTREDDNIR
jgi:hypothetical protein